MMTWKQLRQTSAHYGAEASRAFAMGSKTLMIIMAPTRHPGTGFDLVAAYKEEGDGDWKPCGVPIELLWCIPPMILEAQFATGMRAASSVEPAKVRLTEDYLNLESGVGFQEGTILHRNLTGNYAPEGVEFGEPVVFSYSEIANISEPA